MIVKLTKAALVIGSVITALILLSLMVNIGDFDKKFSSFVILAFVAMLGIIAAYTYTRFFDEGVIVVPSVVQRALVAASGIVVLMVYANEVSNRVGASVFNRLAPIPAFLAFFYIVVAVIALGGDAFLGPIRNIVRLGRLPKKHD